MIELWLCGDLIQRLDRCTRDTKLAEFVGVTLDKASAEHIAHDALEYHAMPPNSTQHSILTFAPAHLVGISGVATPALLGGGRRGRM